MASSRTGESPAPQFTSLRFRVLASSGGSITEGDRLRYDRSLPAGAWRIGVRWSAIAPGLATLLSGLAFRHMSPGSLLPSTGGHVALSATGPRIRGKASASTLAGWGPGG